ncbi:MAG TPA: hypothetical protein VI032_03000 [Burkholderiaceae bacterium]
MPGKFVMRWLASAALALAALMAAMPASAQAPAPSKAAEQLRTEIALQFGAEEQLDAALKKAYGVELTEEKAAVSRRALRALLFNDATADYIAKSLTPDRVPLSRQDVLPVVMEGILELQVKGLRRLAPNRQAQLVSHLVDMARALPHSACKALLLGQMATTEAADLERRFIASLPLSRFEGVVTVYREATEAELAGYPDARTVNAQQARLAQKAYDEAIGKRVRAQAPRKAIARVNADTASAPADEVCAVLTASVHAMLDMPEPYKSWQLSRFVQAMQ